MKNKKDWIQYSDLKNWYKQLFSYTLNIISIIKISIMTHNASNYYDKNHFHHLSGSLLFVQNIRISLLWHALCYSCFNIDKYCNNVSWLNVKWRRFILLTFEDLFRCYRNISIYRPNIQETVDTRLLNICLI